ncbi:hypothetical protein QYF61_021326 [Mycteria americana]|uniref:Uncharacterized protein n=1 Tax=Mycteria americana TaxID=33587 RepID=A0AAN7RV10_MYCAM|nr:hypothetical protein QYF61_021326 [Mycteria americana]
MRALRAPAREAGSAFRNLETFRVVILRIEEEIGLTTPPVPMIAAALSFPEQQSEIDQVEDPAGSSSHVGPFRNLMGWGLHHCPGQPGPMLDNPFSEEKFPHIQSRPPLAQLEAISSRPITCDLGEETDPTSLQPPFRPL